MRRPAAALALYAAGIEVATWAGLVPATWWQQRRGRVAPGTLDERLGAPSDRLGPGPRIVVHAVSLGELAAARGLLAVIAESVPDASVTLTVGTSAARAVADAVNGSLHVDAVQYLPWDRPRAIRRWLSALRPSLVVILETELWPGLLDECRRLGVPVVLASARVYPGDVRRYRLIRGFLAPLLEGVSLIAAQSAGEVDRLIAIGAPAARTIVTGDLKAVSALRARPSSAPLPASVDGCRTLIVGGSTHDPEEQWLLAAFASVRRVHPQARLALAPRALGRAPQVVRAAESAGFTAITTSTARTGWDVVVVDEPGALEGLYRHAAIAVVGGSFVPHGGHSLLEAAAAGVAVVCGPHTAHVDAQVARFGAAEAVVRADRESLAETLVSLVREPARARALGSAAREVVVTLAAEAARVGACLPALLSQREDGQTNERAAV